MKGSSSDSVTVRWSLGRSSSAKIRKISGRWSRLGVWSHIRVHLINKNVNAGGLWSHIGVWSLIKGSFMTGTTVVKKKRVFSALS